MTEGNGIIDSEVAAMLLGISKNNLRQLVHRKQLVPIGRQKRRSTFHLADVMALQTRRGNSGGDGNISSP
jgi:hypothetical protein